MSAKDDGLEDKEKSGTNVKEDDNSSSKLHYGKDSNYYQHDDDEKFVIILETNNDIYPCALEAKKYAGNAIGISEEKKNDACPEHFKLEDWCKHSWTTLD